MQFELTEAQRAVFDAAYRYAEAELHPLLARMDDEDWYPDHLMAKLGADGYCGLTVPEAMGGAGMDLMGAGLVAEAFGYWNLNAAFVWGPHENLCLNNILRNGTPEQLDRFIPDLCAGRKVGALGLTEPGAGSDALGSMAMRAVRDGDDYVLTGRKMFISNGPVADLVLTYAKTAPELGPRGISAFVVETDTPGFSVGQVLNKMGWRGCPTGELVFEGVRVPAANRLGPENGGVGIVMSGLDIERAFLGLPYIGAAQRCLDLSLEHAATRRQFGKPIGAFQMVQAMLADMQTELYAARMMVLNAAWEVDQGLDPREKVSMVKYYASEMLGRVADKTVQIFGGMGYCKELNIEQLYRDARVYRIFDGASDIHRMVIARSMLKSGRTVI